MAVLFINAAFRDGSRSLRLCKKYLDQNSEEVKEIDLGVTEVLPLDRERLALYNEAVAAHDFRDPMFDFAKEFTEAEEIVISAPFWNYGIPAVLHTYLELVCTQGISFDIGADGVYHGLCKAKKLSYFTTAGGYIPEEDHAFGYVKLLAEKFWEIPEINYVKAEGLDVWGTDVEAELRKAEYNIGGTVL